CPARRALLAWRRLAARLAQRPGLGGPARRPGGGGTPRPGPPRPARGRGPARAAGLLPQGRRRRAAGGAAE
ncbi:unnamed protein product, partial [Prorocentrum cordatum]